jgi:hypothetical protein
MANFPTSPKPVYPIAETPVAPEILISQFRDGGEQRRLTGAGKKRLFKLKFGGSLPITTAEKVTIQTHYNGQNGMLTSFNWTHPETAEVIKVRYAALPTFELVAYNFYNGTVELQEVPA